MEHLYEKVHNTLGRTFVCGDLHGEITKLEEKLIKIDFDYNKDIMISVGDLIDRGSDSVACLRLLNEPWFKCVRGNHEQMAIDALTSHDINKLIQWLVNGGDWYSNLSQESINEVDELISKCDKLPYMIEVETTNRFIVIAHADHFKSTYEYGSLFPRKPTLWDRTRYYTSLTGYCVDIEGAALFIFGHTPVDEVVTYANQMYIDTGAVFDGELSVIDLEDLKVY